VRFTPVVAVSLHITAGVALVDDQERHRRQFRKVVLACAGQGRIGQFFEQGVCLAVDHAVALLNGGAPDRLCQTAFAGARRAEKERIFPLRDEARGRELADERVVHLLVEIEIKVVERAAGITKAGQFVPALEQAILSPV
jgi:hypothetical protein